MARTAACPSCGAPVEFRSAASILAVCEFCRSTLLRGAEVIENLGRMADLVPDNSPLQIGAEGRWGGRHFGVVGRIQLRYDAGLWNEWHLLFDDGRSGWLSEAGGEYVISFLKWVADPIPAFDKLVPGEAVTLDGRSYEVTNIENAECVSGAGELPFKVGGGYPAPLVDLRSGDQFATIDYSDGKPLIFFGKPAPFAAFGWANLRQDVPLPKITEKAEALQCPACGAPIAIHDGAVASVACAHCGAQSDCIDGKLELVQRAKSLLAEAPWLPLGSSGALRGEAGEIIGAMVRSTVYAGVTYAWREYLMLTKREVSGAGISVFVWLTEYNGHWTLARTLSSPPKTLKTSAIADIKHDGVTYQHFQRSAATVDFVIGEFTWKVRVGDRTEIDDYVAPPAMLSREWTEKEVVWSRAEYVEPEEIVAAFKVAAAPPARIGVGSCQPSPLLERHRVVCRRFWQFASIAVLIQLAMLVISGQKVLLRENLALHQGREEPVLSREFSVDGDGKLTIRNTAGINNNWLALNVAVVDKKTGRNWSDNREISYYYGSDGGESWSEGSREDAVVFRGIPAGTYMLAIDPEIPADAGAVIGDTVEVIQGERIWSNIVLFLVLTSLFPIFTRWRQAAFEIQRWEDSDHPKIKSSDGDDDD